MLLFAQNTIIYNKLKEIHEMANPKKMIAVRFSDSTQKEVELIAEKLGMSQSAAVIFLTHLALSELRKQNKNIVAETVFENSIAK